MNGNTAQGKALYAKDKAICAACSLRGSSRSIEPAMLTFSESRLSSACTADLAELSRDQICRCERFAVAKIVLIFFCEMQGCLKR